MFTDLGNHLIFISFLFNTNIYDKRIVSIIRRDRGSDKSYKEQMAAAKTHMKFIEGLKFFYWIF
jgi:hypothetical protein